MASTDHDQHSGERDALFEKLVATVAERNAALVERDARDAALAERQAELAARDAALAERQAELAARDAELTETTAKLELLQASHARLWEHYAELKHELALMKRRIFVATAERVDTTSLQLEFESLNNKLNVLAGLLPDAGDHVDDDDDDDDEDEDDDDDGGGKNPKSKKKSKGRRDLSTANLEEVTETIACPHFEELVAAGTATYMGVETSYKLAFERGGYRKLVVHRKKYKLVNAEGDVQIKTASLPTEVIPRCLAAPSALAHVAHEKFAKGMPLYRQEEYYRLDGVPVDRGTMCRWLEELGGTLGATVVAAMRADMLANAFCIMTDATGFSVQPGPRDGGPRRPCRKGHFFVQIADRDHILFDYTPKHTTEAVRAMFKGFAGVVQADAASVYDALFKTETEAANEDEDEHGACTEAACWSHARRKYWAAALAKEKVAREALLRISKICEIEAEIQKGRPPPSKIKQLRQNHLALLVDEFLDFAATEYERVKDQRGSLRSALGYSVRQADALRTFLQDGRLRLDNNLSEGALRKVVRIRDASLFAGSDDHAESAAALLSLIASARLHGIDAERYLRDMIRLVPQWPRERFLELAPNHWAATRARIDSAQLDLQVGFIDVPALDATPQ